MFWKTLCCCTSSCELDPKMWIEVQMMPRFILSKEKFGSQFMVNYSALLWIGNYLFFYCSPYLLSPFMKMTINVWKSTLVILLMWRQNLEHWMLNTNGLEWINQFNFQLKWKFKMLLAHLITVRVILQNWVIPFTCWAFKLILKP